jgi:hypothetical protein
VSESSSTAGVADVAGAGAAASTGSDDGSRLPVTGLGLAGLLIAAGALLAGGALLRWRTGP